MTLTPELPFLSRGDQPEEAFLLAEKGQTRTWGRWTVELSPQTKSALKLSLLAIGSLLLIGAGLGLLIFLPAGLPITILTGGIALSGGIGLASAAGTGARQFKNQQRALKVIENGLGDPEFFKLLFSLKSEGAEGSAQFLMIISKFLEENPKYHPIVEAMMAAAERENNMELFGADLQKEARKIHENLHTAPSTEQLISVSSETKDGPSHKVGLHFREFESGSVLFSIFNSGFGLSFYPQLSRDGECFCDLQASWIIPLENLTPEVIEKLLDPSLYFEDKYELVNKITNREGPLSIAEKYEARLPIRLQKAQKESNCTMEWIFAYLKYQMPRADYYEFRKNLFEKALEEAGKTPEIPKIIEKHLGIIEKRIKRKQAKAEVAKTLSFPETAPTTRGELRSQLIDYTTEMRTKVEEKLATF